MDGTYDTKYSTAEGYYTADGKNVYFIIFQNFIKSHKIDRQKSANNLKWKYASF